MDIDLSSMWLAEELKEMEYEELMNKQYDHKRKPAAYNINYNMVIDNTSTTAAADYLSPESYTDTESCFTDRWLSTPTSYVDQQPIEMKPPAASATYHQKTAANTSSQKLAVNTTLISSSNTFTISFGDLNNPKHHDIIPTIFDDSSILGRNLETADGYSGKLIQANAARTPLQTRDHVLAERNRREKLNRHFISLSALLPNLKKMDKATVLEDATDYIKQLQERVKELEELSGVKKKDATKCVIALKRSTLSNGDGNAGSSSNDTNSYDEDDDDDSKLGYVTCKSSAAEIEVRMSGSCVLVRIYSQKNSSLLVKVLDKMQNHGLSVISSSVMPFANNTTLIAVVAQIESEFSMTAADIVKNLQLTL